MVHRSRHLLIRQRTMLVNALRGHLAEFGIVAAQGLRKLLALVEAVNHEKDDRVPAIARQALQVIIAQMQDLQARIRHLERELFVWHRANRASRHLETIPGIGVITATAVAATVTDPRHFKLGRQLPAWLGLVPRQNSTGGKERLGHISKMGNRYIRKLLVVGATALTRFARNRTTRLTPWIDKLLTHPPASLVSVALANKMALIAWAVLSHGKPFNAAVA